jgi:hypothetical protein
MTELEQLRCDFEALKAQKAKEHCPNCGYCPHCGRSGHQLVPYYPVYPVYPTHPAPWPIGPYITWTTSSESISDNGGYTVS